MLLHQEKQEFGRDITEVGRAIDFNECHFSKHDLPRFYMLS
jgi:hypothetical protein